jgi:AsmA protein
VTGTFATKGPDTDLDLLVDGNAVPVDSIEAFLPSVGVHLPEGSQLRGGTLTTALKVTGSAANPTVAGALRLDSSQLTGFDLGAKLATLSTLTGGRIGKATSSGTNIRSLTTNLQESGGNVRTDNLNVDVAGLGTATGSGTVSASSALDYRLLLKLTGLMGGTQSAPVKGQPAGGALSGVAGGLMSLVGGSTGASGALGSIGSLLLSEGIPVAIGGTASHPTFTPNLAGLTRNIGAGALRQALPGKQTPGSKTQANPLKNVLGGLLGH